MEPASEPQSTMRATAIGRQPLAEPGLSQVVLTFTTPFGTNILTPPTGSINKKKAPPENPSGAFFLYLSAASWPGQSKSD